MRTVLVVVSILVGCHASQPPPAAPPPPPASPAPAPPPAPPAPVAAPSLDGYWSGVLAGKLHLALTIKGSDAVLDSIDQGAKLPVDNLSLKDAAVHFEIARVNGSYDGKLAGDRIEGTWTQKGIAQPLAFTRGTAPPEEAKVPPPAPLDAPIDVVVPKAPAPLHADGHTHLVYELHITNFSRSLVTLASLDVVAGDRTLATFDRKALGEMMLRPGNTVPASEDHAAIAPGGIGIVFVWVTLDGAPPAKLDHRIAVKTASAERTVSGPTVAVATARPTVVAPPLKGSGWVAANGPSNTSAHRRALIPIGGRARISQRFAIDWVKVGDDGKTFTGDVSKNASYHAYGEKALAVGPGIVVEVKDGVTENVPQQAAAVPITLDTIAGNHVVIDLGNGAFGMWAHLQPGSVKVKVGDRVKTGQELGLVGNSGNSSEPHLHFQISDAGSPLGSDGVPYAFPKFSSHKEGEAAKDRKNELPTEDAIVTFP